MEDLIRVPREKLIKFAFFICHVTGFQDLSCSRSYSLIIKVIIIIERNRASMFVSLAFVVFTILLVNKTFRGRIVIPQEYAMGFKRKAL